MTDAPRLVYRPRPDTSPEDEHAQLAAVFRFVLDTHAKKAIRTDAARLRSLEANRRSSEEESR
jgi:hypothetical protein